MERGFKIAQKSDCRIRSCDKSGTSTKYLPQVKLTSIGLGPAGRLLKEWLKHNKLFYRLLYCFRAARQNRAIAAEQVGYERQASALGVTKDEDTRNVFRKLRERLKMRGIVWPPSPVSRPLHVLYLSVPGNWERHNIPPDLKQNWDVSCFFLKDNGIPVEFGWNEVRRRVDDQLPKFVCELHARAPVDLILSYLSGSQISSRTITRINAMGIPTFSFHFDDRRFFNGQKFGDQWSGPVAVCGAYDLNLTNSRASLIKYRCEGANALFWPEGANPSFFRPLAIRRRYQVSFCGARYGQRPFLVEYLRARGIRIDCFGRDWEHGYQSEEDLVEIFNASEINLGFGYVTESNEQCLKGRDFEVPACGALYLTSYNEDLARVYTLGKEIETYSSFDDCAEKIHILLADPERCERIRSAAREAATTRNSWTQRVFQLLNCEAV